MASNEVTFRLNSDYIRKKLKESKSGHVSLPQRKRIARVIIDDDVESELAAKVTKLGLNYNPVSTVSPPEALAKFANLTRLDGDDCRLDAFPAWIEKLPSLEGANLQNNVNLGPVPPTLLSARPSLTWLRITNNAMLREFPTGKYLTFLNVSFCDIRSLPNDFFHHRLERVEISDNEGLRHLPLLPPTSPLKALDAENCSLELIHPSYIRQGIHMNLKNNKIKELPREELLRFLGSGGVLSYDRDNNEDGGIAVNYNPVIFPPKYVLDQGKVATNEYLENNENTMVDPKEIPVVLLGNQMVGKTSLGLSLAGKILNASEIRPEDRTEVFNCYKATVKDIKLSVIDVGGHEDYHSTLPLLARDNGTYILVVDPSNFESDKHLDDAVWLWIVRILEVVSGPHFIIVITKIDTIDEAERGYQIESFKRKMVQYLESKSKTLDKEMNDRKMQIEKQLKELENQLAESTTAEEELVLKLQDQKRCLKEKLSRQINKIKNKPNFHTNSVTFISSITKYGFSDLETNLESIVTKIPKIQLQDKWSKKISSLLTEYKDKPFIRFDEFLNDEPQLPEKEVISLLVGMNAVGRILWSPDGNKKQIILHEFEKLGFIMRSMFHHDMGPKLENYAKLKKLEHPGMLFAKYQQGLLPLEFIRSMFVHISKSFGNQDLVINVNYDHFQICSSDQVFESFFEMMIQLNIVKIVGETQENMIMCYIPFLVSMKPYDEDKKIWNINPELRGKQMELGILFTFDTLLSKILFSNCCNFTIRILETVANMLGTELSITSRVKAQIVKFSNYEILIQHLKYSKREKPWPYPIDQFKDGESGLLLLIRGSVDVCPESVWMLLHELACKLELEVGNLNGDCQLVCPKQVTKKDFHHGFYYPSSVRFDSFENVNSSKNLERIIPKCKNCPRDSIDLRTCFPTQAAIDIMECLKSKAAEFKSPFNIPAPPIEDCLDVINVVTYISTENDEDLSKRIKSHPMLLSSTEKFFIIRDVKQWFDNLERCDHQKCRCYLSAPNCVENFAALEENSCLIIDGDWKIRLQPILDKHGGGEFCKVTGKSSSSFALVREWRNTCAHFKPPSNKNFDQFFKDVEKEFPWGVMHCFTFCQLMIPGQDPSLRKFALLFKKYETATHKEYQEAGRLMSPINHRFLVRVFYPRKSGAYRASLFYSDTDETLESFKQEISSRFNLPVEQQKVEYVGLHESGVDTALDKVIELNESDSLTALKLDTGFTHLIHVSDTSSVDNVFSDGDGTKLVYPLFKVKVLMKGLYSKEREIHFNFDPETNLENFKNAVTKRCPVPVEWQKVKYLGGIFEPEKIPDLDKAIDLDQEESLSSLNLDPKKTHFFQIIDTRKIIEVHVKLVLEEDEEAITHKFFSHNKLEDVGSYIKYRNLLSNELFFIHNGKPVGTNSLLDSLIGDDRIDKCEIIVVDTNDHERKREYMGRSEESKKKDEGQDFDDLVADFFEEP